MPALASPPLLIFGDDIRNLSKPIKAIVGLTKSTETIVLEVNEQKKNKFMILTQQSSKYSPKLLS